MSNMRAHFGVAVLEDYLYVVGGFNSNGYLELVERYNTVNNVWSAVNPMNAKRANAGIGILNGKIYAVGGQNNIGDDLQSVEFYDPATTKWTMVSLLRRKKTKLHRFVCNFACLIHQSVCIACHILAPVVYRRVIKSRSHNLHIHCFSEYFNLFAVYLTGCLIDNSTQRNCCSCVRKRIVCYWRSDGFDTLGFGRTVHGRGK